MTPIQTLMSLIEMIDVNDTSNVDERNMIGIQLKKHEINKKKE